MRKTLFILTSLILLNFGVTAYSYQVTTYSPLQPVLEYGNNYPNSQNNGNYQNDTYPKITQIEGVIFGRTFANEDIYNRLNRIETKMFNRTNQNESLAQRVDAITQSINPDRMSNIPLDNLAQIESKLFNRSYVNDDVETRIIRLEKEMLGAMQQGELEERYEVVATAAKHYNASPYDNNNGIKQYNQPYLASNTNTGRRGILQNVLSALAGGGLTGFTPPITDPYGYCSSPYMNNQYNSQNNWAQNMFPNNGAGFNDYAQTNTGFYNNTKNYGTGSGVHVLYD